MTSVSGRSPIELTGPLNAPRRFPFRLFRAPDTSLGLDSPNEPSGATASERRAHSAERRPARRGMRWARRSQYWRLARRRRRSGARPQRWRALARQDRRPADGKVCFPIRPPPPPAPSESDGFSKFPAPAGRKQRDHGPISLTNRPDPKNAAGTGWEVSCGCIFACNKILHHFGRVRARAWIVLTQGMNSRSVLGLSIGLSRAIATVLASHSRPKRLRQPAWTNSKRLMSRKGNVYVWQIFVEWCLCRIHPLQSRERCASPKHRRGSNAGACAEQREGPTLRSGG